MEQHEKERFVQMLTKAMGAYGKPLPEPSLLSSWWEMLKAFPLRVVGMAFAAYCDENGEFPPVPAGISKRCKLMDGRPTDDEAWAIALTSRDEEDTVVWTEECAEAFAICSSVFPDEVGARMAFKDAYSRLVSAARLSGKPVVWNASLGWDAKKRDAAIERAHVAGLLAAPTVQALLPNYSGAGAEKQDACPEGLKKVKAALATLQDGWAKAAEKRESELIAKREAESAQKAKIAEEVLMYEQNVIQMRDRA
ncbi:hypothetical protein [Herbaspirillum sp. ST 5-3]|uniref:hypothetical protein n=1 Tax=Oxalobacteraceae TaxID=75682 RepID=UPI0010A40178|nr:hypothetical protein [Herbaspirillum sp. ST 5-3]